MNEYKLPYGGLGRCLCFQYLENIHREVQMYATKPKIGSSQKHTENPFKMIY